MKTQTTGKKPNDKAINGKRKLNQISPKMNEEILSESDEDLKNSDESELEEEETVQEKKIRLAKSFIEQLEKQKEEESNDKDQTEFVSRKLEEDLQTKTGKLRKEIANKYSSGTIEHQLKGHRLSVTCVAITSDANFIFSGSKDGSIIKWNSKTGNKVKTIRKRVIKKNPDEKGHTDEILSIAISSDSKFLATGGKDRSVKVWNPDTCEFIYSFEGHRDTVTGVVFRLYSHQLFSSSFDRSVKVWDCDQLVYVETLFGHQDKILGIDSLSKERCITCGARDRSIRLWKIIEESQLLFNGTHFDSIDCVSLINEEQFVSGSNDGSLAVWSINKKKPIVVLKNAHKSSTGAACWISSVTSYHNTDLLASGSDDGFIRVWSYSESSNSLKEQLQIPINGFVNDLKFSEDGSYLIAAIGQEHKLGRWSANKSAKNSTLFIKMALNNQENDK